MRQERPTAILSAMTHLNIITILADLLSRAHVTTIVTEHNAQSQKDPVPRELALAKYLYLAADHVVGVSEGVADDISQWSARPRNRISVIHNPIVTEEMLDQDIAVPSHPWFSDEDIPVIVGAGRHVPQKDFSTLLRSMKSVRDRHQTDTKLVLLGDGPQTETLKILARELSIGEHVSFPGFVDDLYPYLRWGDVFTLSSRWEGFGNVLVEAMAFGTPVVSTDCPSGPAEILAQGDYGCLTPVGDAEKLSTAIAETLAHPPDPERLRARAREFSVVAAVEKYEQLLHSGDRPT